MNSPTYANPITRSHYSCGTAVGTVDQIIDKAKADGLSALGITDRSTMSGVIDFYNKGKKKGLPIMIGMELFVRTDAVSGWVSLLVKNQDGYKCLCKISTALELNRQGKKEPNIHIDDICHLLKDMVAIVRTPSMADILEPLLSDDVYIAVAPYKSDNPVSPVELVFCKEVRWVVTSDAFMPTTGDRAVRKIMSDNLKTEYSQDDDRFMMSLQELLGTFVVHRKDLNPNLILGGIKNSEVIAQKCGNISLKFPDQLVNYPHLLHPLNDNNCSKEELLMKIIISNRRFDIQNPVYWERLQYELRTIFYNDRINLVDYFLVTEDLVRWCGENNEEVGPGRGSGAGSLILYGCMVTDLDPIKHGLLFERFISKGRIEAGTLPDVDIDFSNPERVRQYLRETYGEDRVIQIGTFQTLKAKGALKDAFKALHPEIEFGDVQKISNSFPKVEQGEKEVDYFKRALEESQHVSTKMAEFPDVSGAIKKLLGFNRQSGIHACGLSITEDPFEDFLPVRYAEDKRVLAFNANSAEKCGVIKYDILGLRTLKFFQKAMDLIRSKYEWPKKLRDIPRDDQETFDAFTRGDTESVFQFNSDVAKSILTKIKIESLEDLSLVTAVGRPGPMKNGQHFEFIKRKNKEVPCIAPHPALEKTLEPTFGIMIYQESVMLAGQILGGFSLAETDDVRKAMGKKIPEVLEPYKKRFVDNCEKEFPDTAEKHADGIGTGAEHIWHLMETFSSYGFNKSHSNAYALIGYYCQWIKVHFPLEWWTACLSEGKSEKVRDYYLNAKNFASLPTVNHSKDDYFIEYDHNQIYMPLSAIKFVGAKAVADIYAKRPFSTFEDFLTRTNGRVVNKRVILGLIFSDAFPEFNKSKYKLIEEYFIFRGEPMPSELLHLTKDKELEMASEYLDFMAIDYYQEYPELFDMTQLCYPDQVLDHPDDSIEFVGKIAKIKKKQTKKKKQDYAVCEIVNAGQSAFVTFWPEEWNYFTKSESNIGLASIIKIKVGVNDYNGAKNLICKNLITLDQLRGLRSGN